MLARIFAVSVGAFILVLIDIYVFQAVKVATGQLGQPVQRAVWWMYWGVTLVSVVGLYYFNFGNAFIFGKIPRSLIVAGIFINYFSKLFSVFFLFVDDTVRLGKWLVGMFQTPVNELSGNAITRSEFLAKTALISAAVPFTMFAGGIAFGAYDYRIRKSTILLPNLPEAFDGMVIGQLSDIHSGSFYNKKAVGRGVEMLMAEKPDLFFFHWRPRKLCFE